MYVLIIAGRHVGDFDCVKSMRPFIAYDYDPKSGEVKLDGKRLPHSYNPSVYNEDAVFVDLVRCGYIAKYMPSVRIYKTK